MKFTVIYYVCIACPTVERTLEMVDKYVEHGAKAFQIDMPSKDPFSETDFVKSMMKNSLTKTADYSGYMEGIREIRRRHPDLELHVVVYNDVIDSIGIDKFIAFGKDIGVSSFMIPGLTPEYFKKIKNSGIKLFQGVTHSMNKESIAFCATCGKDAYICLRNRKPGEEDVPGLETWTKKYNYIREHGVDGMVYSVFGIKSKEQLQEIRDSGAQGAIIGNVLMRLWDDEEKLWPLLESFQSLAE